MSGFLVKPFLAMTLFPIVLGQAAPSGALNWIEVYFWIVGGVLASVMLVRQFMPGQHLRHVTITPDAIKRAEFDKERDSNDERHIKAAQARKLIHHQQAALNAKFTGLEAASLHMSKELNQLRQQLSSADERHDKQLEKIHDRIDALPGRVAEQLRIARTS